MANILVFGASTTYGAWDISGGGWVQRLRKFIDEEEEKAGFKNHHLIYNLGISGDKTAGLLKRFEGETQARIKENKETIFLFHIGINDAIYNQQQGKTETTPEKFAENLTKLITLAKKYSQKIILIGSMPVDSRVDPMPWSPDRSYQNEHVERFNSIVSEVATKEGVNFIEIFQEFINENYSKLLEDGVHMNDEGHKQMAEVIMDYLVEKEVI